MAETLIFHFQHGNSRVHRMSVPLKLAGLFGFSLMLLPVSFFRLSALLPLLLTLHRSSAIKIKPFLKEGAFFLFMSFIIFFFNRLGTGSWLIAAARTTRFIYILWAALIFTYATDPLSISSGLYHILKHIPFLPVRHICTTLGLTLTMIPVIIDQIREIREAMQSRCGMNRKNPVKNMILLGTPLMEGILVKAEDLSDAMESRLFSEEATPPDNRGSRRDGRDFLILLLFFASILIFEKVLFSHFRPFFLIEAYY